MDSTTRRTGAPGSSKPVLQAKTQRGQIMDPSPEDLFRFVSDLGPDNQYLTLDRFDGRDGDYYAQAFRRDDGTWIVEYRDGDRSHHYQASASDPGIVYEVLFGWALQRPGWGEQLTWRLLYPAPMSEARRQEIDAAFEKLGRDLEDGTAKREAMAEVKAEGREWSELDENQWRAALFCLGYPPDMEQPMPEKKS
jgi:hypothetical protein